MSNIVILMRHGKAKQPREETIDFERELSEAGRRSLEATLPDALALVPAKATVQILSSPAVRAMQTAQAVLKACKKRGIEAESTIEAVNALWEQDGDAFLDVARACKADIALAVGHNPFIEEYCERLCGSRIVFATGGFAAIDLSAGTNCEGNAAPGRLLWFAQGPVSQRWKTLVQMERIIADAADAIATRRDAFFENPEDIETAHKLRVSIRTLRSLVAFVAPWQKTKQNKAAQADLKRIVGCTSRLRELDVFADQAENAEGTSAELVTFCRQKAAEERRCVIEALASKGMERRFERVIAQLHAIAWRDSILAEGLDADEIRARFDSLAETLGKDLSTLDLSDAERTHDVRKRAKQVRYDAEQFEKLIGEDAVDIAKGMTEHQDNLGAICDARVNIGIVDSFAADELPERAALDLALLRAQNETFLYTTLRDSIRQQS